MEPRLYMTCAYGCSPDRIESQGRHQCSKCKKWYCDECHKMFLPIDNQNWQETNLMCAQCHYETYKLPKFQQV